MKRISFSDTSCLNKGIEGVSLINVTNLLKDLVRENILNLTSTFEFNVFFFVCLLFSVN